VSRRLAAGMLLVTGAWYLLAWVVSSPVVPMPHTVLTSLLESLGRGDTYRHVFSSFYRIGAGLGASLFLGIPLGMLAGRNRALDRYVSPVLYLLYPLPKIAFLPVFMVLLGIGDLSKIALITAIITFPMAINVRDRTREIMKEYGLLVRAFHLRPSELFRDILLPGLAPGIFASLRVTLGISLSVLFIAENYASSWGMGCLIMNSWVMADYTAMYTGIVLLSLTGLGLYLCVDLLEAMLAGWDSPSR
jgi:ABC-type nitrate/sulfonate/bicarbonate transport system permease component